jgi:phage gpG-like protein
MPVSLQLEPPIGFILRQTGAFRMALENLLPLWRKFEPTMEKIVEEQFDSQGHGAWPGLAESTIEQKAAHGYPLDPLVRTGALKDSFHALAMGAQQFVFGTEVPYAHWHQTGGYVAGRPPKRQEIPDPLPADERRKLEKDVVNYVNEAAARTFGAI